VHRGCSKPPTSSPYQADPMGLDKGESLIPLSSSFFSFPVPFPSSPLLKPIPRPYPYFGSSVILDCWSVPLKWKNKKKEECESYLYFFSFW